MAWGIWQIFTRLRSKVSKFGLLLGPFIQSRKYMSLKFTGESDNEEWYKILVDWSVQIDIKNLMVFDPALKNINNLHFNGLLLTKAYNVSA